jgi:hypothetical protein
VEAVETAAGGALSNRGLREPQREKILERHDTPLRRTERRERHVHRSLGVKRA